jgi:hypothetical protein
MKDVRGLLNDKATISEHIIEDRLGPLLEETFKKWHGEKYKQEPTPLPLILDMISRVGKITGEVLVVSNVDIFMALQQLRDDPRIQQDMISTGAKLTLLTDTDIKIPVEIGSVIKVDNLNVPAKIDMMGKKFDVVIGNPPYQSSIAKKVKLWPKFIQASIDQWLVDNGDLVMVFPRMWAKRPTFQGGTMFIETLKNHKLVSVIIDEEGTWFDVGETTCIMHLVNAEQDGTETIVSDLNGRTESVKYNGQILLPDIGEKFRSAIVAKSNALLEVNGGKYPKLVNIFHEDVDHSTSKEEKFVSGTLSKVKRDGDVECWWTASQMYYCNEDLVDPRWRVMMNVSGYYFQDVNPDKYIRIAKGIGSTTAVKSILCDTEEEAKNVRTFVTSKLYRFLNDEQKTSGFNTFIWHLPFLGVDKTWTDDTIYEHFGLTDDEIEYINSVVAEYK